MYRSGSESETHSCGNDVTVVGPGETEDRVKMMAECEWSKP